MTIIAPAGSGHSFGEQLQAWRRSRRQSQLDLALAAGISQKHLSFVETGRSRPSRDLVLNLSEQLEIPLRERNRLLLIAGFAPLYPERSLDDPEMAAVRSAIDMVLEGHEPYPAMVVDRRWTLVAANASLRRLIANVAPHLLAPPVNVLRLSLDSEGLAPRIVDFARWRRTVLARLRREMNASRDDAVAALYREFSDPTQDCRWDQHDRQSDVAVPFALMDPSSGQVLSFIATTTIFGTATDVALAEMTLECFYPADSKTRTAMSAMADRPD